MALRCGDVEGNAGDKGCPVKGRTERAEQPAACLSRKCTEGMLEADLRSETLKWQKRAQNLFEDVCGDDEFLDNVSAYIHDCQYFIEKDDLIRAFEAVIWAWAWMEIGLQKGLLQQRSS
ncbi:MAG: DUF357 domain-containing protein [Methanothrix sp.]|nr:DUF357 domain-containing protein [Methanothrix sp.]